MTPRALAFLALAVAGQTFAAERPNVVLIVADDHGWHEVDYYGHPHLQTPELAAMARAGLRFDRFYSAAPNCAPTRASLMTGRHPNRMGTLAPNFSIRPQERTLPQMLREAGYSTAHFGKWHLGPVGASSPTSPGAMGFETWLSHENFFGYNPPMSRDGAAPKRLIGESSESLVEEAIGHLEGQRGRQRPFFVYLCFGSPHDPYAAIDDDVIPYAKLDPLLAQRFGEIVAVDRAVGRLRRYLREAGLAENTIVWYVSDNGAPKDGAVFTELRGFKGTLYEGGVRVPSILEWPARVQPATTAYPAVTTDILPTLAEWLGLDLPQRTLDGVSLVAAIEGRERDRPRPIGFWAYDVRREERSGRGQWLDASVQKGFMPTSKVDVIQFRNFKPDAPRTKDFGGNAAWRDNRFKLVVSPQGKSELFDILADPGEARDLAAEKPDVAARMLRELDDWRASVERSYAGRDY